MDAKCRCGLPLGHSEDERFTFGLLVDVMETLKKHGYEPSPVDAQQALFRLLHGPADEDEPRERKEAQRGRVRETGPVVSGSLGGDAARRTAEQLETLPHCK